MGAPARVDANSSCSSGCALAWVLRFLRCCGAAFSFCSLDSTTTLIRTTHSSYICSDHHIHCCSDRPPSLNPSSDNFLHTVVLSGSAHALCY